MIDVKWGATTNISNINISQNIERGIELQGQIINRGIGRVWLKQTNNDRRQMGATKNISNINTSQNIERGIELQEQIIHRGIGRVWLEQANNDRRQMGGNKKYFKYKYI